MKHFFILFISFISALTLHSQQTKADSLLLILKTLKNDTTKVNVLNALAFEFQYINPDSTIIFSGDAIEIAHKLKFKKGEANAYRMMGVGYVSIGNNEKALENYNIAVSFYEKLVRSNDKSIVFEAKKGMASSYNNIGMVYFDKSDYDLAHDFFMDALRSFEDIKDIQRQAACHNNIGNLYERTGEDQKALEHHLKALRLREQINDKRGMAYSYNSMGNIFANQRNQKKALEYYEMALKLGKEIGDKYGMASFYNNMGIIYKEQNFSSLARDYYFKSLVLYDEIDNPDGISSCYNNIGETYSSKGDYNNAIKYYNKALKIEKETGDKQGLALSLNNIGILFSKQKKYLPSIEHLNEGLKAASEINYKEGIKNAYEGLSQTYAALKKYDLAYENFQKYSETKDSLLNEKSGKNIIEMQTKYETEKKEQKIILLDKDNEIKSVKMNQQQNMILFISAGLLMVILLAAFIYRGFIQKKKANIKLDAQKKVIEMQRDNILDSIQYASYIQQSVLKAEADILKKFPFQTFVLFLPRDVVSGDFYWFGYQNDICLMVAADCTGHGVPGALLSMIGSSLLNEIVYDNKTTNPEEILEQLDILFRKTMGQNEENARMEDGMDISVCAVDVKNKILAYAGAENPLYVARNGKMEVINADSTGIGGRKRALSENIKFTHHEIIMDRSFSVYLSSDGYIDQIGGENKKRIGRKKFQELLAEISLLGHDKQREALNEYISSWKGSKKQLDDILIIGASFDFQPG